MGMSGTPKFHSSPPAPLNYTSSTALSQPPAKTQPLRRLRQLRLGPLHVSFRCIEILVPKNLGQRHEVIPVVRKEPVGAMSYCVVVVSDSFTDAVARTTDTVSQVPSVLPNRVGSTVGHATLSGGVSNADQSDDLADEIHAGRPDEDSPVLVVDNDHELIDHLFGGAEVFNLLFCTEFTRG